VTNHPLRTAFDNRDLEAIASTHAEGVIFHSPVIGGAAFEGKAAVRTLYEIVLREFVDLTVTHEFVDGTMHALLLTAEVRGQAVQATAAFETDEEGLVREIWVMARPLRGGAAIAEAIGTNLAGLTWGRAASGTVFASNRALRGYLRTVDRIAGRLIRRLDRTARLPS
jgi:hypothetical protein